MATTTYRRLLVSVLLLAISTAAAAEVKGEYGAVVREQFMGQSPRAGSRFLAQGVKQGERCEPKMGKNVCASGGPVKDGMQRLKCCKHHCRNVLSDRNNCGACSFRCRFGELCCKGRCTAVAYDVRNCGECGQVCQTGQRCEYGACGYA